MWENVVRSGRSEEEEGVERRTHDRSGQGHARYAIREGPVAFLDTWIGLLVHSGVKSDSMSDLSLLKQLHILASFSILAVHPTTSSERERQIRTGTEPADGHAVFIAERLGTRPADHVDAVVECGRERVLGSFGVVGVDYGYVVRGAEVRTILRVDA